MTKKMLLAFVALVLTVSVSFTLENTRPQSQQLADSDAGAGEEGGDGGGPRATS